MFPEPFRHTCKGLARRTSVHAAADAYGYNGHLNIVSARRRRRDAEVSGGDYADNTRSATNREVEIVAVIPADTPEGEDEISSVTGRVFVPKTPEIFTYDGDGNMTGDGLFRYFWNEENRMVCASNAEVVVTYAYDHRGRMIRKNISRGGAETQSISYTWDNWNIIRETQTTGRSLQTTYNVWGLDLDGTMQGAGGVGGLLAVVRDGETYVPAYDANGNISEYIDSSSGVIAAHRDYSPFGEPVISVGDCSAFSHWFSTKPWCCDTKLLEYQFRKYNAVIGRWMSRDPIGEKGGLQIYGYCNNGNQNSAEYLGAFFCDKCNPKTDKNTVLWFDIILKPAFHGNSPYTEALALSLLNDIKVIGYLQLGSSVIGSLTKSEGVAADILLTLLDNELDSKRTQGFQDAILEGIAGIQTGLMEKDGIVIWVGVKWKKCEKQSRMGIWEVYDWNEYSDCHKCTASNRMIAGFNYDDSIGIAEAIPICIAEAIEKVVK